MPAIVVDTSVVGSWVLADEYDAQTQALAEQVANSGAIAPALLLYEIRNLMVSAIRSQRVDAATVDGSMAELRLLPITFMKPNPVH